MSRGWLACDYCSNAETAVIKWFQKCMCQQVMWPQSPPFSSLVKQRELRITETSLTHAMLKTLLEQPLCNMCHEREKGMSISWSPARLEVQSSRLSQASLD